MGWNTYTKVSLQYNLPPSIGFYINVLALVHANAVGRFKASQRLSIVTEVELFLVNVFTFCVNSKHDSEWDTVAKTEVCLVSRLLILEVNGNRIVSSWSGRLG